MLCSVCLQTFDLNIMLFEHTKTCGTSVDIIQFQKNPNAMQKKVLSAFKECFNWALRVQHSGCKLDTTFMFTCLPPWTKKNSHSSLSTNVYTKCYVLQKSNLKKFEQKKHVNRKMNDGIKKVVKFDTDTSVFLTIMEFCRCHWTMLLLIRPSIEIIHKVMSN